MEKSDSVVRMVEGERNQSEGDIQAAASVTASDDHDVEMHGRPTMAVISAVAAALETDPTELDPLANTIDPDALNRLVEGWLDREQTTASINFTYCGCSITVKGNGKSIARQDA